MHKIRLGPAGSPGRSTLEGIQMVKDMGLQTMEVEFVRGVHMGIDLARQCGELAKKLDIELSIHAPYYINLASAEKKKILESKKRILDSVERGHHLGAGHVVFHPAYYGKLSKEETFGLVKEAIEDMKDTIRERGWKSRMAPETTGKHSAFGNLEETLRMAKETGILICIDFAHLYARNRGTIDYGKILDRFESLGRKHLQAHFSNIEWTLKGERSHKVLNGSPPFRPLAEEILNRKLDATIICESPITWKDSLKMKKVFEELGHVFG
jgi:deoxyribonuclease-4